MIGPHIAAYGYRAIHPSSNQSYVPSDMKREPTSSLCPGCTHLLVPPHLPLVCLVQQTKSPSISSTKYTFKMIKIYYQIYF